MRHMTRATRGRSFVPRHMLPAPLALAAALAFSGAGPAPAAGQETCLLVSAENIVTGAGNWYAYIEVSARPYTFVHGDQLEYDILLPGLNPVLKGGVDADLRKDGLPPALTDRRALRDCGLRDQGGIPLHGDGLLEPARERWYQRRFDLSPLAGATAERWTVVFEGDPPGRYIQFLANLRVTRGGQTVFSVYESGPAPAVKLALNSGYSREVLITTAPRDDALGDTAVRDLLARARRENELRAARDRFRTEIEVARELGKLLNDEMLLTKLDESAAAEDTAAYDAQDAPAYLESLRRARQRLGFIQPRLRRFVGHLVGHAHIDLQWLWGWDETVHQIIPDTFGQAVRFMQEFPEFTFSQSSAALYLATEQHHPELFRQIQEYQRQGRWELVGGRWCEGDLNMISPESHVRHFLYAQRYFQQKFGRICTDGWEPDTFGHPWTMPQILRKAGIRSYYFCRAGKKAPLFWWEGPDGSRVLAFEEPPTGGWYIDVVNDDKVRELVKFAAATGSRDHLMVYGVGNHGGGPTRENIEAARAMGERQPWPQIRFSTLREFFGRLYEQAGQLRIPTIRAELNPVFEGCYTSHSRIKKYNRDSESLLESAEAFAALAALVGTDGPPAGARYRYPRAEFESLWRDVLWNHHHDTLCGSCVHASAEHSAKVYEALLKRGSEIRQQSQQALAARLGPDGGRSQILVFNALAWTRSEVVEAAAVAPAAPGEIEVADAEGPLPTQVLSADGANVRFCFLADRVPGCGLKVFRLGRRAAGPTPRAKPVEPADRSLAARLERVRDAERTWLEPGLAVPPAQLQMIREKPRGMSAWELGEFERTTELSPTGEQPERIESGPVRTRLRRTYAHERTMITLDTVEYGHSHRVDYELTVDWNQIGRAQDGSDMLKIAFRTPLEAETATYEIPFGDVARPNDGHENVALKWCDLTGRLRNAQKTWGLTVLNDCKHAYDVKGGVLRVTLLRSSYEPDPAPDVGRHSMRLAVLTHGEWNKAAIARAAWAFNKPLQVLVVDSGGSASAGPGRPGGTGTAPASETTGGTSAPQDGTWSGCTVEPANVIVTALKLAEDGDDLILRAYECAGQRAEATFTLGLDLRSATETDLLERDMVGAAGVTVAERAISAAFKPYEIRTFRIRR